MHPLRLELKYGRGRVGIDLDPGEVEVAGSLSVLPVEPPPDPDAEIARALANPIGSPPLRDLVSPSDDVCIVVNDPTRLANTASFLPALLNELRAAGVREENAFVVFACGAHREVRPEEALELLGPAAHRIRWHSHDASDQSLTFFGTTSRGTPVKVNSLVASARVRVLTGSVVHHFFAGFGGGRKALIPGVAGLETIAKNHSMMLLPGAQGGRLRGNPVHEDLLEAAKIAGGADFIFNVVLDPSGKLLGAFAGDMQLAHEAACRLAERAYSVPFASKADIVLASAGGHPRDLDLYQAQKSMEHASMAVRDGGAIVLFAECPDGVGSEVFHRWARRHRSLAELERALKAAFELGGHKAYAVAKITSRVKVILHSSLDPSTVEELGLVPARDPSHALKIALEAVRWCGGGLPKAYVIEDAGLCVPRQCVVMALGDSITSGFPFGPGESWAGIAARLSGVKVVNEGIPGDTVMGMCERVTRKALAIRPTHVVVTGGTNDAYLGLTIGQVTEGLELICQRIEEAGAVPVLGLPIPADSEEAEEVLAGVRSWIREHARSRGYHILDFHHVMMDPLTGRTREGLTLDGTHPNERGHEAMASVAAGWLRSLTVLGKPRFACD